MPKGLFSIESSILSQTKISDDLFLVLIDQNNPSYNPIQEQPDQTPKIRCFLLFDMNTFEWSRVRNDQAVDPKFNQGRGVWRLFFERNNLIVSLQENAEVNLFRFGLSQDFSKH